MFKEIRCALAALALGWAGPLIAAEGITYDCALKGHPSDGFVAPRLLLSVSADGKSGVVYDGLIHTIAGKPMGARIEEIGKGRYRFNWRLEDLPSRDNQKLKAGYTARLDTRKMKVTMQVNVIGYDNTPRGSGTCKLFKRKR